MKHHRPTEVEQIQDQALAIQAIRIEFRARKPLWLRLREVQDRCKILSTVPSGGISEYTTRGKTEGREPPAQQPIEIRDRLAMVEHALELLEDVVDAERGMSPAKDFKTMRTEDLDKELLKWRGVPSFVVAVKAPWLGRTPRTIERARQRLNVRQSDGEELPPTALTKAA